MVWLRAASLEIVVLAVLAMVCVPAGAQAAEAPAFAVGPNKVYAHATADSMTVWMNTLVDDGGAAPYYLFGSPTVGPQGGQTPALEPVANGNFEARIALTPALAQDLTLQGTVNVQAYIGGGTYTAGRGTIATSLVAGGASLGSAAGKTHQMSPKQAGQTYDPIAWTFDVPATQVPAGTLLEWVITGTGMSGNNIYLAAHEARGRSYIELPVAAAGGGAGGSIVQHTVEGTVAQLDLTAATPTNATHVYNWTTALSAVALAIAGNGVNGSANVTIVDGANATLFDGAFTGAPIDRALNGTAGNWTIRIVLASFQGNLTLELREPAPAGAPQSGSSTHTGTGTRSGTGTGSSTDGNATDDGTGSEGAPAPGLPIVAVAIVALAALGRRRVGGRQP